MSSSLLTRMQTEWMKRIESARKAREPWKNTADICTNFYQGALGFMWESKFRESYFSSLPAPRFKLTIGKAFELVAVVGPMIYWDYVTRSVQPHQAIDVRPEAFGDIQDPNTIALYDQFMVEYGQNLNRNITSCSLMEKYLNYSQQEQPYGGLVEDSKLAVNDALITGRGVLWTQAYGFPGGTQTLTGSFWDSPYRLFIDADCTRPNLSDAMWVARQHVEPYWVVERRFGLEPGTLRSKSHLSDEERSSAATRDSYSDNKVDGKTHEMVVWYEIFSKCGATARTSGGMSELNQRFEEVVGDFAYICVTPELNRPLNISDEMLLTQSEDFVRDRLAWPCPYYKDSRWPCALLDFYPSQRSPWPIAPIAPGIGELVFLNLGMSCLMERVYENSRNIRAFSKTAGDEAIAQLKSMKFSVDIEMGELQGKSINDLISYIETPSINPEFWNLMDRMSMQFDKRVGLPDFMYGVNQGGKVTRVAADVSAKSDAVTVRPDYMASCVTKWQAEVANIERICTGWNVKGSDVEGLFGKHGAALWDMLIAGEDPEVYVRGMKATVDASSARRPNKNRTAENMNRIAQYLLPVLQARGEQSGDWKAYNGFVRSLGNTMDLDTSEWALDNPAPPQQGQEPPPELPPDLMQEPPPDALQGMM